MAAAAAGIFSHHLAAGQALTGTKSTAMDSTTSGTSGTGGSSDASGDSSTISANDFLTLLVTEMQNQDPTADTDPNEYINQNLSTALGDSGSSGSSGGAAGAVPTTTPGAASASPTASAAQARVTAQHKGVGVAAAQNAASSLTSPGTTAANSAASKHAPGNLSVPDAQRAAQRVAHALNGKSHSRSIAGNQTGSHGSSFTRRP